MPLITHNSNSSGNPPSTPKGSNFSNYNNFLANLNNIEMGVEVELVHPTTPTTSSNYHSNSKATNNSSTSTPIPPFGIVPRSFLLDPKPKELRSQRINQYENGDESTSSEEETEGEEPSIVVGEKGESSRGSEPERRTEMIITDKDIINKEDEEDEGDAISTPTATTTTMTTTTAAVTASNHTGSTYILDEEGPELDFLSFFQSYESSVTFHSNRRNVFEVYNIPQQIQLDILKRLDFCTLLDSVAEVNKGNNPSS